MKCARVEQVQIRKHDPLWRVIDQNCYYSKNLYNYANYIIRQEFINNGRWIRYNELAGTLKESDPYKELMSQPSQQTLAMLDAVWKSFFTAIKDWNKNPSKYLGMPKLPRYLPKDGRYIWSIKNNSCRIRDGVLSFQIKRLHGITFPTKTRGRLLCVRFVPRGNVYIMEIVTEVEVPDAPTGEPTRICGIDLGVNNLVTMANNIGNLPIIVKGGRVKAINQFYNKRKAAIQSELKRRNDKRWSHRLDDISLRRNNQIKTFLHLVSRRIVQYCTKNSIDTLVCGLTKDWKQEINTGRINNQMFCFIPFNTLLSQLEYKCQETGIRFMRTEEAYTSGTSFLDGEQPIRENYDKTRRVKRGLFQSSKCVINADVNAAYQIIKKVAPNAFSDGVGAEGLQPLILKLV
jgi:putative transposase